MRTIWCLLLSLLLSFSIAGCGGGDDSGDGADQPGEAPESHDTAPPVSLPPS